MLSGNVEFEEGIVDNEYLRRKQELSKRIAELRGERIKLRQELTAYKKYERTGEKPLDDPTIVSDIMRLKSDIESEGKLSQKLKSRDDTVEAELASVKNNIQNITDLIQKYKVENIEDTVSESGFDHLKKRKSLLEETLKLKKQKNLEINGDLERLKKESSIKNQQEALLSQISSWQQGNSAEPTDHPYVQQAFSAFKISVESWREAKFNYDRKNLIPDFYQLSKKALLYGIDAHFVLLSQEEKDDLAKIDLREKVDLLYKNKIVVNTTLLDSLISFVDRINHDVDVNPQPNYPERILEFMTKNMTSLKTA